MGFIDMHCDTLWRCFPDFGKNSLMENGFQVDFRRMKAGGASGQVFAVFMDDAEYFAEAGFPGISDDMVLELSRDFLLGEIDKSGGLIAFARNYDDLRENERNGKMSAFMSIEDGRPVDGSLDRLAALSEAGFFLITILWNRENCFGYPNISSLGKMSDKMSEGLKPFGKDAVERMNELGMIVDVSHLSDGGFYDVAAISKKPFAASHSNARAICPHGRNLTDDMIRVLAEAGGIAGINFCPAFLDIDMDGKFAAAARMAEHASYMANVGGIGVVGLGSDFDGVSGELEIGDPSMMWMLFAELEKLGFTGSQIDKFSRENFARVLKDVTG